MPRKAAASRPADRKALSKPAGRQAAWAAMYEQSVFTVRDIARATDVPYRTVATYVQSLITGGILQIYGQHDTGGTLYLLPEEMRRRHGAAAPRVNRDGEPVTAGLAAEQMWRTMKRLGPGWSPDELAGAASTDQVAVSRGYAHDYAHKLMRAGYLRLLNERRPVRYVFLPHRDSGPLPPRIQTRGRVFDPNLGRVVYPAGTTDRAADRATDPVSHQGADRAAQVAP